MKGVARIRLKAGRIRLAELHWYEAHRIGKKEFKRKAKADIYHEELPWRADARHNHGAAQRRHRGTSFSLHSVSTPG
jgi:hypothetical protein